MTCLFHGIPEELVVHLVTSDKQSQAVRGQHLLPWNSCCRCVGYRRHTHLCRRLGATVALASMSPSRRPFSCYRGALCLKARTGKQQGGSNRALRQRGSESIRKCSTIPSCQAAWERFPVGAPAPPKALQKLLWPHEVGAIALESSLRVLW